MGGFFTGITDTITSYDLNLLKALHYNVSNDFLDWLMPLITKLGDKGLMWIIIAVILLIPKKTRRVGAGMGVAMLLGLIIGNGLLKNLIMRPRPFDVVGRALRPEDLLIAPPTDYSFPSGHTLSSFAAATAIYKDHTLFGFVAYVMAGLIAFSRMYLYVHYPSDILGGIVLGLLLGLLGTKIVKAVADRFASKKLKNQAQAAE